MKIYKFKSLYLSLLQKRLLSSYLIEAKKLICKVLKLFPSIKPVAFLSFITSGFFQLIVVNLFIYTGSLITPWVSIPRMLACTRKSAIYSLDFSSRSILFNKFIQKIFRVDGSKYFFSPIFLQTLPSGF